MKFSQSLVSKCIFTFTVGIVLVYEFARKNEILNEKNIVAKPISLKSKKKNIQFNIQIHSRELVLHLQMVNIFYLHIIRINQNVILVELEDHVNQMNRICTRHFVKW